MYTRILGQLRVETRAQYVPLPYGNDIPRVILCARLRHAALHLIHPTWQRGQDLNLVLGEHLLHNRGADEDARKRRLGAAR